MSEVVRIGFWKSAGEPDLPMPVAAHPANPSHVKALRALEARVTKGLLENGRVEAYRGMSGCRICGIMNGNKEFSVQHKGKEYRWPEGYMHYLVVHGVQVAPEMVELFEAFNIL